MKGLVMKCRNEVALVMVVMLFFMQTGCATMGGTKPMTGDQVDALKAKLGKIGVVSVAYLPKTEIQVPAKGAGEGAMGGAATGAAAPFQMMKDMNCNDPGCFLLPVLVVALVPVGAVIGGVGGAMTADDAATVADREKIINQSLTELRMQENLRDQMMTGISDLKTFPVTTVNDQLPSSENAPADYSQLKKSGIDTVNEVSVRNFALTGSGRVKPDLAVQMTAQVRLVSTSNNAELFSKKYVCTSSKDKFEAWAAEDAKKFHDEIEQCYKDISNRAVNDMYVNDTLMH